MNYKNLLINKPKEFEKAQQLVNTFFITSQTLPNQVFNEHFSTFSFDEFDWALTSEFWEVLQQLAKASNDTHIITASLDPDPVNYFFKEFGLLLENQEGREWVLAEHDKITHDAAHRSKTQHIDGFIYQGGFFKWIWWKLFGTTKQHYNSGYHNRIVQIVGHIKEEEANKEEDVEKEEEAADTTEKNKQKPRNELEDQEKFDEIIKDILKNAITGEKTTGRIKQFEKPGTLS